MDTKRIKDWFGNSLVKDEMEFIKFTDFKQLRDWDISGRDDCTYFYVGTVNDRFFWYKCDKDVWYDQWGFMDEMEVTNG